MFSNIFGISPTGVTASIPNMASTIITLEAPEGNVRKKRRSAALLESNPVALRPMTRSMTRSLPIRTLTSIVTSFDTFALRNAKGTENRELAKANAGKKRTRTPTEGEFAWNIKKDKENIQGCIVVAGSETDSMNVFNEVEAEELEGMWERPEVIFEDEYGLARTSSSSMSRSPPPTPTTSPSIPQSPSTTPPPTDRRLYSPSRTSSHTVATGATSVVTYRSDNMDLDTLDPILDHIHERIDHTNDAINHVHNRMDEVEHNNRTLAAKLEALERRMQDEERAVGRLEDQSVAQDYEIREVHRRAEENKSMIEEGFGLKRKNNGRLW
ncbi:hypothetical protein B0T21DRAFT_353506 [Apiosordaria backusii]|uniref:Uncharacterized protein n=1 Tax=Apiosordaria backusii TaxID=314023 RepID=A0AA39ZRY6_9PEZI|nr:hypothetical protein B0T21DRAFT_353506 [Apiosordaria backusii]